MPRIAILVHERSQGLGDYAMADMVPVWRERGMKLVLVRGPGKYVDADLLIVHVDLSVVPDAYLEFASRYPRAVNGRVRDIRKSTFSRNLLSRDSDWPGPVIVKSDLNCGGAPERLFGARPRDSGVMRKQTDYQVFERAAAVPEALWQDPDLVVERFLPECAEGLYWTRSYHFFGDRHTCVRQGGPLPVVSSRTETVTGIKVEPHPEIVRQRHALGLDYGKMDYVVRDGVAYLLDVNKTTGRGGVHGGPAREARRFRAGGIDAFLAPASGPGAQAVNAQAG